MKDLKQLAGALGKLGYAHQANKKYGDAIKAYEEAAEKYLQSGDATAAAAALESVAFCHQSEGRNEEATKALGRAIDLLKAPEPEPDKVEPAPAPEETK